MGKRLIVCLDGTWNTPDDKKNATNVVKIMRAIRSADDAGTKQVVFYDKGVGTGGPIDRVRGGAFGGGLGDNVKDGYRFLANNYEPDDEIYLFGFSRGAFTARCLAGFIGACGLLNKHSMGRLPAAWEHYRTRNRQPGGMQDIARHTEVPIRCVGVWDTVGALGVPVERLKWMNRGKFAFFDTTLGPRIDCALHALAIDEQRGPFAPTLWQTPARDDQVVEQVWFAGVHSNIGGSYDDPGLSDIALDWMIKRVDKHTPLSFDPAYIADKIHGDPLGTMYESRSAMYAVSRGLPYQRVIGGRDAWVRRFMRRSNKPDPGQSFVNEALHRSVLDRFGRDAPFQAGGETRTVRYEPQNVAAAKDAVPIVGYDGEVET